MRRFVGVALALVFAFMRPASADVQLVWPQGLALDDQGTLYIADAVRHQVLELGADGTLSVIAGTGSVEPSGDGGLAIDAGMSVFGIDESEGSLYIAGGDRVRRVDLATGIIGHVAGGGERSVSKGDGGPATSAFIASATDVVADPQGRLFVTEIEPLDCHPLYNSGPCWDSRVRRIVDGVIDTVMSTEDSNASLPRYLSVDALGRVTVVNQADCCYVGFIRHSTPGGDTWIDTTCGLGINLCPYAAVMPLWFAKIEALGGTASSTDGLDLYLSRGVEHTRNVTAVYRARGGLVLERIAGSLTEAGCSGDGGPASAALFGGITDLEIGPDGTLYVADRGNGNVRAVDPAGMIRTVAGAPCV